MKRRTKNALLAMISEQFPVDIKNVSIASFYPTEREIQKLIALITPVQTGAENATPSNIRNISGFDEINVYVSPSLDPQDANVYTSSWIADAGTVYGGVIDVVKGILTVDRLKLNFSTLRNYQWSSYTHLQSNLDSDNGVVSLRINASYLNDDYGIDATRVTDALCNCLHRSSTSNWNQPAKVNTFADVGGFHFLVDYHDVGLSSWSNDANTVKNAFFNSSLYSTGYAVFYLASPVVYSINGIHIPTISGKNNVWCSTGKIVELQS